MPDELRQGLKITNPIIVTGVSRIALCARTIDPTLWLCFSFLTCNPRVSFLVSAS